MAAPCARTQDKRFISNTRSPPFHSANQVPKKRCPHSLKESDPSLWARVPGKIAALIWRLLFAGTLSVVVPVDPNARLFDSPICLDLMQEPHVTKCGHTYCFQCITQSLERKKSCPKCLSPADCVFPNFLLNDLITRHRQLIQDRKHDVHKQAATLGAAGRPVSEIQELLEQRSDQLAIADLNHLILTLRRKKRALEQVSPFLLLVSFLTHDILFQTSVYVQNELLKEFLVQARQHKLDQMEQLTRELNQIERDVRRAEDISAGLASTSSDPSLVSQAHASIDEGVQPVTASDSNHTLDSSANAIQHPSRSNGSITGPTAGPCSSPPSTETRESGQYSLSEKKIKMMAYYDVLESCYLNSRFQSSAFAGPSVAASSGKTLSQATKCRTSSSHVVHEDDFVGLSDFSHTLNQFTSYNGLRPLATLCYTPDLFSGSSIVSSIEFDKENEYFAIAGVTKKIKLFDYSSVISSSDGKNDMHYPLVEMECNSKISCVSWSSYMKSMMVSSDYEGSVIVWDAFTAQKLRVFQEHEKRCWSVDFNKIDTKLVASGSDDAKVKLWSTNVQHSVATLVAKANVCCVKFNPSQRYHLAFGSADHSVHYYDLRNTKSAISVFKGHEKAVSYVKFLNESQLVSASTDSQLKLWSLTENQSHCIQSFRGHINEKNFVGLATSGDFIACGSENNSLYVYFRAVSRHMLSFRFDAPSVPSLASDTDTKSLVSNDSPA